MSERVEYPYACQNMGCPKGKGSTFYSAPPSWFSDRGLSEPKNCSACKEWKKTQTDKRYRCKSCPHIISQPAKWKIVYYGKIGPYTPPTECARCERGEKRDKRRKLPKPITLQPLQETPVTPLELVDYRELGAYRLEHYGKHIIGHPDSKVGQLMRDGKRVSPTTIVGNNVTTQQFHEALRERAARTDSGVYEYRQGDDVVKVTMVTGEHVEVSILKPVRNGKYEPRSSFDTFEVSDVLYRLEKKLWK
jgi:hypothetical protein